MRTWESYTLTDLPTLAREILHALQGAPRVWLFRGQMGAGKTTLSKELIKQLGVVESVQSPTFSLVNEYQIDEEDAIYHFDVYRLKSETEAYDMGIEEYLYSGHWCFIEWAEKIPTLIPNEHSVIRINVISDLERELEFT